MDRLGWQRLEEAPAGRVPWAAGPWTHEDGTPLHGVWAKDRLDGTGIVVVANHGHALLGWVVPRHRWRFASPLVRASSCALAQIPWVWRDRGQVVASDPHDVAIGLVLAGRKPAALADTDDPLLARRWLDAAESAGLAVRCESSTSDCGPVPTTRRFVEVAVTGTPGERFDLAALLEDYRSCLPPATFAEVEHVLTASADVALPDLVADADLTLPTTPGEYARTGLVLGYDPATTAGIILGLPDVDWAADEVSAVTVNVLARAADRVPLPGLASAFAPLSEAVR